RRLYTTNERVSYDPTAIVMISSRDPHFNRPDVAERLLPFHFERPAAYQSEDGIFRELESQRDAIWGDLLTHVARVADGLTESTPPAMPFRMADFAAFGWRVWDGVGKADKWISLMHRVEQVQAAFAAEGEGVVSALRILLGDRQSIGPVAV